MSESRGLPGRQRGRRNNVMLFFPQTSRTYCAAKTEDLSAVIEHARKRFPHASVMAVGVSMGGYGRLNLLHFFFELALCKIISFSVVFIVWCYTSIVYAMAVCCMSVCVSITSRCSIQLAKDGLEFSETKDFGEIPMRAPPIRGTKYSGVGKICTC